MQSKYGLAITVSAVFFSGLLMVHIPEIRSQETTAPDTQAAEDITALRDEIFKGLKEGVTVPQTEVFGHPAAEAPLQQKSILAEADRLTQQLYASRDRFNLYKVLTLCALCLIVFLVVVTALARRPEPSGGEIVKATGLILVVFGTIFLVLVAEQGQQLTAPIGILGAIAGYLFGATSRPQQAPQTSPPGPASRPSPGTLPAGPPPETTS